MDSQACPLPTQSAADEACAIARMLSASHIAVVGLSPNPARTSHHVSEYLQAKGYHIIPVNPTCDEALGRQCYKALADVPPPIDMVLVFRRPEFCEQIAREAVAAKAKGLWLQTGIINAEARRIASGAGIDYVEDRCMMVERMRKQ